MSKLRFRISMSLDGFIAGPHQSVDDPLGVGGMRLHEWVFPLTVWRSMHGLEGGDVNESSRGVAAALAAARRAAGGKDVALAGGARIAQQYLHAGLVDEMEINLVPTLLGSGERLFDGVGDDLHGLALVRTVAAPRVTHLKFERR
jgi:hypothetical protein